MNSYKQQKQDQPGRAVANSYLRSGPRLNERSAFPFEPHARLEASVNRRPQVRHVAQLQQMLNTGRLGQDSVQFKETALNEHGSTQPIQRQGEDDLIDEFKQARPPGPAPSFTPAWPFPMPFSSVRGGSGFFPWAPLPRVPNSPFHQLLSQLALRFMPPTSTQNAPPQAPPRREFAPMENSSYLNFPSGVLNALGMQDERVSRLATQQLLSHRNKPDMHHVFVAHSNASQVAMGTHTHHALAAAQADQDNITKAEALQSMKHTEERNAIIKKTWVVSAGGPQSATDLPPTNVRTFRHRDDPVPQLPTHDSLTGQAVSHNLQILGSPAPPFSEVTRLVDMEPEEAIAHPLLSGFRAHEFENYREPATRSAIEILNSLPSDARIFSGEGWGGTDESAMRRSKELEEAFKASKKRQ